MSMKILAAVITAAIAFTAFEAPAFAGGKHRGGFSFNANGGKGGNHNSGNNSGNGGAGGQISF